MVTKLIYLCVFIFITEISFGQKNNINKIREDDPYGNPMSDEYFKGRRFLIRTNIFEYGVAFEWPHQPEKWIMKQISLSYNHNNWAKICFIIPEIMPQYLNTCRTNQFKGINFKYEKKYYAKNGKYGFKSFIAETGMHWTPSETEMRGFYTWASDPIPFYKIHHLYNFRLGGAFGLGFSDEIFEFGIYFGGQIHYYDLKYEMSRGNYYVHPTGEDIRETGIRFWPNLRILLGIKIFNRERSE